MQITQCQDLAKEVNSQLRVLEVFQEMDPKAEATFRSWRRVFGRIEIDII